MAIFTVIVYGVPTTVLEIPYQAFFKLRLKHLQSLSLKDLW